MSSFRVASTAGGASVIHDGESEVMLSLDALEFDSQLVVTPTLLEGSDLTLAPGDAKSGHRVTIIVSLKSAQALAEAAKDAIMLNFPNFSVNVDRTYSSNATLQQRKQPIRVLFSPTQMPHRSLPLLCATNVTRSDNVEPIVDELRKLRDRHYPEPNLLVRVVGARDLLKSSVFRNSDPYVTLSLGNQTALTPSSPGNLDPRFNSEDSTFGFAVRNLEETFVVVRVLDRANRNSTFDRPDTPPVTARTNEGRSARMDSLFSPPSMSFDLPLTTQESTTSAGMSFGMGPPSKRTVGFGDLDPTAGTTPKSKRARGSKGSLRASMTSVDIPFDGDAEQMEAGEADLQMGAAAFALPHQLCVGESLAMKVCLRNENAADQGVLTMVMQPTGPPFESRVAPEADLNLAAMSLELTQGELESKSAYLRTVSAPRNLRRRNKQMLAAKARQQEERVKPSILPALGQFSPRSSHTAGAWAAAGSPDGPEQEIRTVRAPVTPRLSGHASKTARFAAQPHMSGPEALATAPVRPADDWFDAPIELSQAAIGVAVGPRQSVKKTIRRARVHIARQSYEEFLQAATCCEVNRIKTDSLDQLFHALDFEGTGELEKEELASFLAAVEVNEIPGGPTSIARKLAEFRTRAEGILSAEEFNLFMLRSLFVT